MNRQELELNIANLLKDKSEISLAEVIETYPIQNGLAEVITYFSIAATSKKHIINENRKGTIPWYIEENEAFSKKEIHLPQVLFVK
jgi:hypothetical protein